MNKRAFLQEQITNTEERLAELNALMAEAVKEEEGIIRSARDKIVEILDSHNLTLKVYLTARQPSTATSKEAADENTVIHLTKNGRERNTINTENKKGRR